MATSKRRLNISLTSDVDLAITELAKRDNVPQATKAFYLLKHAIEIEEDDVWNLIAEKRDKQPDAKFISHKKAWK